jgi:hypothetical protein
LGLGSYASPLREKTGPDRQFISFFTSSQARKLFAATGFGINQHLNIGIKQIWIREMLHSKNNRLKKILLVSGRSLSENPHRELRIKHLLEQKGVEVVFIVPGRFFNKSAPDHDIVANSPLLQAEGAVFINGEYDFRVQMRGCQVVAFSSWRGYLPLTRIAQSEGRPTINFMGATGVDHWTHGVERCLVSSQFIKEMLEFVHENLGDPRTPPDQIRVVGSIQYEYPEDHEYGNLADRAAFIDHYGMNPKRPIVVLFPKGIQSFHSKLHIWFPDWDTERVDTYNQRVLDKYGEICHKVREADCNLLIKMHPSAYASYKCMKEEEDKYWKQYPWAKVVLPEHSQYMFQHADVGIGITTFSALDMGYFGKPFIYVDSDIIDPPSIPEFSIIQQSKLIPGPSSHWHSTPLTSNPWFHSWLGAACRVEDLPEYLQDPKSSMPIPARDHRAFIKEFWYSDDGLASERIVDEILSFSAEMLSAWKQRFSLRRIRGNIKDKLYVLWAKLHN